MICSFLICTQRASSFMPGERSTLPTLDKLVLPSPHRLKIVGQVQTMSNVELLRAQAKMGLPANSEFNGEKAIPLVEGLSEEMLEKEVTP